MNSNIELTQEIACELLEYNLHTGNLTWKSRSQKYFKSKHDMKCWNSRYANKRAGYIASTKSEKYMLLRIFGKMYRAHRIIMAMQGYDITGLEVDHIDGDGLNNCLSNLRLIKHRENALNQGRHINNTSNYVGVYWDKSTKKWKAEIQIRGKKKHLGRFLNKEDAITARKNAEKLYKFHSNHGTRDSVHRQTILLTTNSKESNAG